jgi:hypothetical protein
MIHHPSIPPPTLTPMATRSFMPQWHSLTRHCCTPAPCWGLQHIYLLPCNSRITFGVPSMNSSSTAFRRIEDHVFDFSFPLCTCLCWRLIIECNFSGVRLHPLHCKYFDSRPLRHYQLDLPLPFFLHDSTRQARDPNVKAS